MRAVLIGSLIRKAWLSTTCANLRSSRWLLKFRFSVGFSVTETTGLYIVIESLRNSYELLHRVAPSFVAKHLRFSAAHLDGDSLRQLWNALSVDPEASVQLCELELRWSFEDRRLYVHEAWRGSEGLEQKVVALLTSVFRFEKYASSRFMSVGASSRTVAAAKLRRPWGCAWSR